MWDVRTGRFEGGWTVELAIPFKSIRYRAGESQTWGLNIRRVIRRKNEWTHLTARSRVLRRPGRHSEAVGRRYVSSGSSLPKANRNFELKPYGISKVITDFGATPARENDPDATGGFDAKYGITANLTADATVNTDFAQVEVDEQQVNLTRFALSYPEKRDFFLEGRGPLRLRPRRAGCARQRRRRDRRRAAGVLQPPHRPEPQPRHSRSTSAAASPARSAASVSGLMNIETREEDVSRTPATNFTVLRVKQDILRRSSVGAMFTNRSESVVTPGSQSGLRPRFDVLVLPERQPRRLLREDLDAGSERRRRELSWRGSSTAPTAMARGPTT